MRNITKVTEADAWKQCPVPSICRELAPYPCDICHQDAETAALFPPVASVTTFKRIEGEGP